MEEHTQTPTDKEAESWASFGMMMRQEDRILYERLLSEAKAHSKAFEDSGKDPAEALLMALILEQHKLIKKLMAIVENKGQPRLLHLLFL